LIDGVQYTIMCATKYSEEDINSQIVVFGALADSTRLKLVRLLCGQHRSNALCVNALAQFLGVSQSAVSQHLRVLKGIGLVKRERRGYHIHYSIVHDNLEKFRKIALSALCVGRSDEDLSCQQYCPLNSKGHKSAH